jgi:hypothetical protein
VYVETPDGQISGLWEDLQRAAQQAGSSVVSSVQESVGTSTSELVQSLIRSSEFGAILQEVEAAAQKAVVEEASKNALNLFLLAVSGGAIGGIVFRGKLGGIAAGILAVYAASQIVGNAKSASAPAPIEKTVRR